MLLPFLGWVVLYVAALRWFVPRLGRVAQAQADARSLMTGRITDAYTNIATVKLFSHARREAVHRAQRDAGVHEHGLHAVPPGHRRRGGQSRASAWASSCGTAGLTLWLWTQGRVGVGAVAAATAMALRLNGISHWVMWEMATLFEHVGTVQDGIEHASRGRRRWSIAPDAQPLVVRARRHPLRAGAVRLRQHARR